ncbi:MAG: glycosyltransferase [bacterium]
MTERRKINVLQLVEGLNWGGAETKLMELIAHMDSSRFNTTVCSLGMGDRIKEKFGELDVKFVNFARRNRFDPKLLWDVNKLIRHEKIDVVMTTLFYADVVGPLARSFTPAKAVFSWETISAPEWLLTRRLLAYKFAMNFCDKVISVSHATAKWLVEKRGVSKQKVMVIPYGVNLELFHEGGNEALRKSLGVSEKETLIGVVARLHPQKGHRYLIEAAESLVRDFPALKFAFVGDGELRTELEQRIKAAKLEKHFLFLGFRNDVKDLLRTFDIFVLPSLYEGLPNVILEAMASGLPVVATAVDGTPELIEDDVTGYLVPPKDPAALATKISALLKDEKRRHDFGSRGRRRIEEEYSLEKQVENFQNLYEKYVFNDKNGIA